MNKIKIKFITIEQLLQLITNNEKFTLVEVLSEEDYKGGHLPGAINLPLEQLEKLAPKKLKKSELVVVYCAGYPCHASTKAAELLLNMGYKNTLDFKGSKKLWVTSGLELEK